MYEEGKKNYYWDARSISEWIMAGLCKVILYRKYRTPERVDEVLENGYQGSYLQWGQAKIWRVIREILLCAVILGFAAFIVAAIGAYIFRRFKGQ